METLGSYNLELSLFNGDLQLVGLSTVEAEQRPLLGCGQPEVKWQAALPTNDGLHQSGSTDNGLSLELEPGSVLLDSNWLDTRVDLLDLLNESDQLVNEESVVPLQVPSINTQAVDETIALVTAEDLFQSIEASGASLTHVGTFEAIPSEVDGHMLMEVLSKLTADISVDSHLAALNASGPVLSPVSAEDVDSLLSYPSSPTHSFSLADSLDDPDYSPEEFESSPRSVVSKGGQSRKRSNPYQEDELENVTDKKLRKKIQNKTAATRYRQKKKHEKSSVDGVYDSLETRNKELKEKVEGMTREIKYLKDLMAEVCKAKQKGDKV